MPTKTTTASKTATATELARALNSPAVSRAASWYRFYYRAYANAAPLRVRDYEVVFPISKSWLPALEERIRNSTAASDSPNEPGVEWLSPDTAAGAIAFFRASAEALPTEPHIYSTTRGDLVAEFEHKDGAFTGVVCPNVTLLFGAAKSDPTNPIEVKVKRGSNRIQEEVAEFWGRLAPEHGHLGTTE